MNSLQRSLLCAAVGMIVGSALTARLRANPPAVAEKPSRASSKDFIRRYGSAAFRVPARQLEFSPDGRRLIAANFYYRKVSVLDAQTGEIQSTFKTDAQSGIAIGFSPDGGKLAIRDRGRVTILRMQDGKKLRVDPPGRNRNSVSSNRFAISPDRKWGAMLANGREILLTRWNQFEPDHRIPCKGGSYPRLAVGKDGRWVAYADRRSSGVRVWKAPKFDTSLEWKPSDSPVRDLAASPDGKSLYVASKNGVISVWNVEKDREGSQVVKIKQNTVRSLLASPDKKHLLVGTHSWVTLYEISTGRIVQKIQLKNSDRDMAFSPDGSTLAIATRRPVEPIELWDVKTGRRIHEPIPPIQRVFARKDPRFFGSVYHGDVYLWNRETGQIEDSFPLNYKPDGTRKAFGSALFNGTEQISITSRKDDVYYRDLAYQKDFKKLGNLPDTAPMPRAYSAQRHMATILGLGVIRLGKYKFSRFEPQPTFQRIVQGPPAWCRQIGFSKDGKTLAAVFEDRSIFTWDSETGAECGRLQLDEPPRRIVFNSDASRLAVSYAETVDVWDLKAGTRRHQLPAGKADHHVITFDFKKGQLATASPNQAIRIWSLETGKEVHTFDQPDTAVESLAFSPDDEQLAAGLKDKSIRVFDLKTEKEVQRLKGHGGAVTHLLFHPDGKQFASGCQAGDLILWDLPAQKPLEKKRIHRGIDDLFWTADEKKLMIEDQTGILEFLRVADKRGMGRALYYYQSQRYTAHAYTKKTQKLAAINTWGIRLLDGTTNRELHYLPIVHAKAAEWAPDGRVLMVAAGDIFGWDAVQQKEVYRITSEKMNGSPTAMTKSPDGRMVATAISSQKIGFREPRTGRLIREVSLTRQIDLKGWSFITSVEFSADGRLLFAMARDRYFVIEVESGLVWLDKPNPQPAETSFALSGDHELLSSEPRGTARLWSWAPDSNQRNPLSPRRLWRGLSGNDGPTVYRSMFALANKGDATVKFLAERLPMLRNPGTSAEKIASLIEDLESPVPTVRRKASEELRELGSQVRPQLRKALKNENLPGRVRARIQILLAAQRRDADPELLAVRGIQLLEWMATPEARDLLQQLAKDSSDRMGTEAKASLERLSPPDE